MNVLNRFSKLLLNTGGIGLVLAILLCAIGPATAAPDLALHKVYVTNVREGTFTVTWTTDLPSNAIVRYGTTTALGNTAVDPVSGITTHEVVLTGLMANTTYYFEVESGGVVDNNSNNYYTAKTAALLGGSPPSPAATVWGYVYLANTTTPVPYTLVYLRLIDDDGQDTTGSSQWVSARADDTGVWGYTLGSDRSEDLAVYFKYTADADTIQIAWQGGPAGTVGAPGSEYYDLVPGIDTQIDIELDGDPTAITAHTFSASSQAPAGQWQAGLLALLLLAVIALLGMQLRLVSREA